MTVSTPVPDMLTEKENSTSTTERWRWWVTQAQHVQWHGFSGPVMDQRLAFHFRHNENKAAWLGIFWLPQLSGAIYVYVKISNGVKLISFPVTKKILVRCVNERCITVINTVKVDPLSMSLSLLLSLSVSPCLSLSLRLPVLIHGAFVFT